MRNESLTVPPPATSPERRLPLRQLTFRAFLQCFPPKRGPSQWWLGSPAFKSAAKRYI